MLRKQKAKVTLVTSAIDDRLIARCKKSIFWSVGRFCYRDLFHVLRCLLGNEKSWSYAFVNSYLKDKPKELEEFYWLFADPIVLEPNLSSLVATKIIGNFSIEKKQRIVREINKHLSNYVKGFLVNKRILLRLNNSIDVKTYSVASIMGKEIHDFLPVGSDSKFIIHLMNDIQMILHGVSGVSSLWVWGGGFEPVEIWNHAWSCVVTNNKIVASCIEALGVTVVLTDSVKSFLQGYMESGDVLVVDVDSQFIGYSWSYGDISSLGVVNIIADGISLSRPWYSRVL